MKHLLKLFAVACAAAAFAWPQASAALPRNEADLTYYGYWFTSPGSLYGPWSVENFSFRHYDGNGSVGFSVENEATHDRLNPHVGQYVVVDNYHDWSRRFYTYASVGLGTGQPFPSSSLFLEGDIHVDGDAPLLLGVGANATRDISGITEHYLSIGPTYYWPHFNATVRYLPLWASDGSSSAATDVALEYGDEGRSLTDLTVQAGGSLLAVEQNGVMTIAPGERSFTVDLEHKQWISERGGYRVGAIYGHLTNRATGAPIYTQQGAVLGVFTSFGPPR